MRLGYSAWGFLGDNKIERGQRVSTPDGNATYSWAILHEAQRRGWQTFWMQKDRDREATKLYGLSNFAAFSQKKRFLAYIGTQQTDGYELPDLDVLLVEWRWPIPGRNVPFGTHESAHGLRHSARFNHDFQPDFFRQAELLDYYQRRGVKVIAWDLDHKLNRYHESFWKPDAIFETSSEPLSVIQKRTRVEPPIVLEELLQHGFMQKDPMHVLSYVGSRYERDDVIDELVAPVSDRFPGSVHFYGNWTEEKHHAEVRAKWPNIVYHDRITTSGFRDAYGPAAACPLLAKTSYFQSGFMTPRIWESLLFGTIPIGFTRHNGITRYLPMDLIANDAKELGDIASSLLTCQLTDGTYAERLREQVVDGLQHMDVKHFVDAIERV